MIVKGCRWAAAYDVDGKYQDDGESKTEVSAVFRFPHLAEEFIAKCMPGETRSRFRVLCTEDGMDDEEIFDALASLEEELYYRTCDHDCVPELEELHGIIEEALLMWNKLTIPDKCGQNNRPE